MLNSDMSSKKKKKTKTNQPRGKSVERKATSHLQRKQRQLEEPDVSRIVKVAEANQLEELGDSFDHPLHSTAVDAYTEEQSPDESPGHVSALQRRNADRSQKRRHSKLSDDDVQESNTNDPGDESLQEMKPPSATKSKVKKKPLPESNTSDPSVASPCSVQVWCPKDLKRSPRDITELDVVLAEFEKIAANYMQRVESNVCRIALNGFCSAFKDQVTSLIVEAQELKNTKKKNAKVMTDIKKKRQRLLELKEELMREEPQKLKLQREYAELEERKSALKQATALLTDLKELHEDCLDFREENPKEKVVYGTSSLPALLLESRRVLGAERHFQNINTRLEEALAVQRGKISEKC